MDVQKTKAIVIGRYGLSGEEPIEEIERKNVNFPATSDETVHVLHELLDEALEKDAALVFQSVPAQLAVAILQVVPYTVSRIGAIVSQPGERPEARTFRTDFTRYADYETQAEDVAEAAAELVKSANPRVRVTSETGVVTVSVEPPMRFKFSHIEWFN